MSRSSMFLLRNLASASNKSVARRSVSSSRTPAMTSLLRTTGTRALSTASSSVLFPSPDTATSSTTPHDCRFFSAPAYQSTNHTTSSSPFPSIIIGADRSITAAGSFAESQAVYLDPDPAAVDQLEAALLKANMGVVAHYYMDVELQGVLQAVKQRLPNRVGIADSLRMGDMAVEMASPNEDALVPPATAIACLGVDFMSESVAAILTKNGLGQIPVYRATPAKIGCSLAESAEREAYRAWLQTASHNANALHVVYINTSLETKAVSNSLVPTITCTSSNVLQTLLQAAAQFAEQGQEVKILYGPDTYMGHNLVTLLNVLLQPDSGWDDARIAAELHPAHSRASLQKLRDAIDVFPAGNCVVHHMFGAAVVETVRQDYADAYVTAHLEVPGEMFDIAMEKSLTDDGVVGSTSDILKFITRKVQEVAAAARDQQPQRLQFILGTEAGMVTSIVESVQTILQRTGLQNLEAEIIFPVAQDAVTATDTVDSNSSELPLVPGVPAGEGCSTAGGCATCPYMKLNDLDALLDVLELVQKANDGDAASQKVLPGYLPPDRLQGKLIENRPAVDWGTEPILYMRALMKDHRLPDELVDRVLAANKS